MGYDKGERERGGQNEGRRGRARFTRAHTHTSRPCAAVFPVLLSELPLGLLLGISHPPRARPHATADPPPSRGEDAPAAAPLGRS